MPGLWGREPGGLIASVLQAPESSQLLSRTLTGFTGYLELVLQDEGFACCIALKSISLSL
jgi:hypothetical protein